jgi:BlaI family transcriptional regulator, penicillinase repressor
MVRPRHENPTPAELEVLQALWERGPSTVREVMTVLNGARPRAYTSVMSLMNVMADKGLLRAKPKGRAFLYSARVTRDKIRSRIVSELVGRVFDGSTGSLVLHLLEQSKTDPQEIDEIRKALTEFEQKKGGRR